MTFITDYLTRLEARRKSRIAKEAYNPSDEVEKLSRALGRAVRGLESILAGGGWIDAGIAKTTLTEIEEILRGSK